MDGAMSNVVFTNIRKLATLSGAMRKRARKVQDSDLSIIEDAAILTEAGKITWVGPRKDLPQSSKAKTSEVDLHGREVIPALVECHTHLIFAGSRANEFERRVRGETYQQIAEAGGGIISTVKATRAASEEELISIGQKRADRFVRQGVTTIEVKSGYGLSASEEAKMLRAALRIQGPRIITTFLGAHALSPDHPSAEAYVDHLIKEAFPMIEREKLARRADIFVEKGYFDVELSRRYLNEAKKRGFDIAVHADQLTLSGGSKLAVELGAKSAEHLIQIKDDEIKALASSEVTCVLLPNADLYLDCPYPPARKLIDQGARVAVATDFNPGSSPSQDIALTGFLSRSRMKMTLSETLVASTLGGAFALGLENELGSIEVGKDCDFVVLENPIDELFLEIGRMPVARVVKQGSTLFS